MKAKIISLLIVIILFSSCKTKIDNPLISFKLGESEELWNKKIKHNLSKRILSDQYENENIFRYYFTKGNDSIFADVHFNSDGYNFGQLRSLKFDLRGDTAFYFKKKEYMRSFGTREIETVDKLLEWFIEYYGAPTDSVLEIPLKEQLALNKKLNPDEKYREIYSIKPEMGALLWSKENYTIEFYRQKEMKFPFDTVPIKKYRNAYIVYKVKNLEGELKKITEPIKTKFSPKDVAHVSIEYPKWEKLNKKNYWDYDYEFKIDISQVQRKGREEPRNITDVQFNIVLTDAFENEICILRDIKCELDKPIELHKGFLIPSVDFVYTMQYNSHSNHADVINLEKARDLNKTNKLKCLAEVTAVVFEDGEVLK
ncbi:MAG TPA: hypothetical protein VJY41_08200 [Prolixibacteraceae bacterium]|nr:hypothetical protein [Prolixibacteraceae bacterium]